MQENETPIQAATQPEQKSANKDYLAPALVFIALFFSFFVLITMQRLTRKVIDGEDAPRMNMPVPVMEELKETTNARQASETTTDEQIKLDSEADADLVGDEIIEDIDETNNNNLEEIYGEQDLQDLDE